MAFIEIGSELFYQIVYSVGLIIGAIIIIKIIRWFVNGFAKKEKMQKSTSEPIRKFMKAIVYIIAFLTLLGIWGLKGELTGLLAGAGFAGIVIGFAVKDVFADLFAGIMLFFDRPFKIGDIINIGDTWATVKDIKVRTTRLKTFDGTLVVYPNSKVTSSVITNVSVYNGRRIELKVGVDYATDLKKAEKAIWGAIKTLQKKGMILEKTEKKQHFVFVNEFANSSINFKILFWYNPEYAKEHNIWFGIIKSELIDAIHKEFKKSKIGIPFPQVTLSERKEKKV